MHINVLALRECLFHRAGSRKNADQLGAQVCILVQLRSFSMGLFFLASIEMHLGPFHRVLGVQTRLMCTPLRTLYCRIELEIV